MPTLLPVTSGSWKQVSDRAIEFTPSGYGYGVNGRVQVVLPAGLHLVGGQSATASSASWTVPNGSLLRAQQLLALLGYLPVNFKYKGKRVGLNPTAQEAAAVDPPAGRFVWRYPHTPDQLKAQWQPGEDGVVTRGAIMMFESDRGMTTDGILSPRVWKAMIDTATAHKRSGFGYSFVMVHEADSGETTRLWHNGRTIITTPANTGSAGAGGTPTGTYPVFEHLESTTMSGINPDGSRYVDPGILWVSYFNGGDALHYYDRASYGFPQSDGCVEMPLAAAGKIWPYTPVGALVDVST
jgi:peptidoglycan hydrolase-like protein with peptidoglycan-binding domain